MASHQQVKARLNHAETARVRAQGERLDAKHHLIGKVVDVDYAKQQATIKIMHKQLHPKKGSETGELEPVDYPDLLEVPIMQVRAGNFSFSNPIKPGDSGTIMFMDRSIDQYYKTGENKPADSLRLNDLSDGVFMPGFFPEPEALPEYDGENFNIRNEKGDSRFQMSEDGKFAMYGRSGEELFTILEELLDHLNRDDLVITKGSSAGDGHMLKHRDKYGELKDRLATIKLR